MQPSSPYLCTHNLFCKSLQNYQSYQLQVPWHLYQFAGEAGCTQGGMLGGFGFVTSSWVPAGHGEGPREAPFRGAQ